MNCVQKKKLIEFKVLDFQTKDNLLWIEKADLIIYIRGSDEESVYYNPMIIGQNDFHDEFFQVHRHPLLRPLNFSRINGPEAELKPKTSNLTKNNEVLLDKINKLIVKRLIIYINDNISNCNIFNFQKTEFGDQPHKV